MCRWFPPNPFFIILIHGCKRNSSFRSSEQISPLISLHFDAVSIKILTLSSGFSWLIDLQGDSLGLLSSANLLFELSLSFTCVVVFLLVEENDGWYCFRTCLFSLVACLLLPAFYCTKFFFKLWSIVSTTEQLLLPDMRFQYETIVQHIYDDAYIGFLSSVCPWPALECVYTQDLCSLLIPNALPNRGRTVHNVRRKTAISPTVMI